MSTIPLALLSTPTIADPARRQLYETSLIHDANLDGDGLAELWHPEGSFQIGGLPKVVGREAIRGFFKHFFSLGIFTRLEHENPTFWSLPTELIYQSTAVYTKADGSKLRSPYANIVRYRDGFFGEYQVFIDTKPLLG